LLKNNARFLIVGAYSMAVHGFPRATGDIDIWVEATNENSENVYKALSEFGAPLKEINGETFSVEGIVYQIGVAPRRIDILTAIDGVNFSEAYEKRKEFCIDDITLPFISEGDLIANKEASGRDKDKVDAKELRKKAK